MRLRNNAPEIYSTFQDQSLRPPSIEDGNVPGGELQGKIFTSEITSADDYSVSYSAVLVDIPTANLRETGTLNVFSFTVRYQAVQEPSPATNPGFFGSNLIKEGDPFLVKSATHDWVRGYVSNVVDVQVSNVGFIYSYIYTLSCTVTQGNPLEMKINDVFGWNRQIYQDPSTFNNAVPPINFSSSYDRNTQDIYFYWDDVNQESRKYRIMVRDTSNPSNYFFYYVKGKTQNPVISIKPFLLGGGVATYKILNPGVDAANVKSLVIKGNGSGAFAYTSLDNDGSLRFDEFIVYDVNVGTNQIYVYANKTVSFTTQTSFVYNDWPTPYLRSYAENLPAHTPSSGTDYYVSGNSQVYPGNNRYFVLNLTDANTGSNPMFSLAWKNQVLNTKIKLHTGIRTVTTGTGYSGKAVASAKESLSRARFYVDPDLFSSFPTGSTWAFSVSAIYDEINKLYTEWTPEEYIKF
jgi:hypothetical protein